MMFQGYCSVPRWGIIFQVMSSQNLLRLRQFRSARDQHTFYSDHQRLTLYGCSSAIPKHPTLKWFIIIVTTTLAIWDQSPLVRHTQIDNPRLSKSFMINLIMNINIDPVDSLNIRNFWPKPGWNMGPRGLFWAWVPLHIIFPVTSSVVFRRGVIKFIQIVLGKLEYLKPE